MNTNSQLKEYLKIMYMKAKIPILIGMLSIFSVCVNAAPHASFTASQTAGCAPLSVQFTSTSTGAVSYYWDLGNGNTSTLPNPANLYSTPGTYTITLTVTDASGQTDVAVYTNYIQVIGMPVSDFSCGIRTSCLDDNLFSFNNASTGATTYLWDFGDGTTSPVVNPVHRYNQSGTFTITLIATNSFGCQDVEIKNLYITVYPKPNAAITSNITSSCDPGTVFNFSSAGTGVTSWNWSFGDNVSSSLQNPSHIYGVSGTYPVSLIVVDNNGCRDTSDTPTIMHVGTTNWVTFNASPDSGCAPLSVTFNNTNANVVSSLWNFGDGTSSSQYAPTHVYSIPGFYSVTLTVTTSNGCTDSVRYNNYIKVGLQPFVNFTYSNGVGCAPHAVQFTNTSSNFVTCQWNFGDGTVSTSTNPSHTYTGNGIFSVTLTCWGPSGCTRSRTIGNIINVSSAHALFSANPRIGCPPLNVNFFNPSYGNHLTYLWDFGDGGSSTLAAPTHTYTTGGQFNVKLIVTDSLGCTDTLYKPSYIQTLNPAANYIPPPTTVGCAPVTAQFTDATVGSVGWLWDFGDGTTSTLQNPNHTYLIPGFYTVSLTTQSAGGGCTQTISNFSTFDVKGGYAGFTHVDSPCPPYESVFTDTSLNAISWMWNFGDGTTSTSQNPVHVFSSPGSHSVSLTITTSDGCSYTTMYSNSVNFPPFGANFYGVPQGTTYPCIVDFYANSVGATGWLWDFGDGFTSTLQNPSHTYPVYADYHVTLTITNGTCTLFYAPPPFNFGTPDSTPVSVGNPGLPEVQRGCNPLSVSFSNTVEGSEHWHWDFGDGDTSSVQFPSHTYFTPGVYTVTLTTVDSVGIVSTVSMDSIVYVSGPIARFSFDKTSSCTSTLIQFHDSSTGAINQWLWNLGDGNFDSTQNVNHTYSGSMPNYIVTHMVTDTMGCSSSTSTSIFANFISPLLVSESEICGLDTVHFNTSLQNFASYRWDFGDGDTSSLESPSHLYTTEGIFNASVTVTDSSGCAQSFSVIPPITVSLPTAGFTVNGTRHGCGRSRVDFINLSSNADSYFWDFGDGSTSNNQAPSHIYNTAGRYTVSLTIYRGGCVVNHIEPDYIVIDTAHAEFSIAGNGICLPLTLTFTDLSTNPVSWFWTFANGDTSTLQNPVVTYYTRPHTVEKLVITDIHGCVDSVTEAPLPQLIADFYVQSDSGCAPFTVDFTNTSTLPNSWYWDFGDGAHSTIPNVSHTYQNPGTYTVMMVVTSNTLYNCTDTMYKTIKVLRPAADFTTPDRSACAPSVVNFTNNSVDAISYLWDFGDSTTSTNRNPSHIYNTPGIYTVSLIASSGQGCADTIIKPNYIYVLGSVTNFHPSGYAGCDPYPVNFTTVSQGAVDWNWSFGDGYASTDINPFHLYQDTGSFTVSVVTHDTAGCASYFELPQQIYVYPSPVSSFVTNDTSGCQPYSVSFNNTSISNDSTVWDFGDGTTSTVVNPTHTYTVAGLYEVILISFNQFGCADTFYFDHPIHVKETPQPAFTSDTSQGCSGLPVSFQNLSTNLVQPSYTWDFGNGATSTLADPQTQYPNPGFYDVSLTILNSNGCSNSVTYPAYIHVFDTLPPPISEIMSVSVTSNTTVEIIWENNAAIDLGAYKLYRLNPVTNVYDNIYTQYNPNNSNFTLNSSYVDSNLNTLQNTYTYKLQVLDLCGFTIGLDQLTAHTTINVSSMRAGQHINVSWNSYGGCPINTYEIYRTQPGGSPQWIASVPSSQLTYLDTTFDCPYKYSYRITATDLCGRVYTSNSDTSQIQPVNTLANQVVDVVRSTVVENQTVLTEWLQPVVHPEKVAHFDLYRSTDNENFSYLVSVPSIQTDYMDHAVDVQTTHYFYKIKVINTCDINESPSLNTCTILLQGVMNEDRSVNLNWSPYTGWETGVDHYIIEKLDSNGNWQLLKQTSGDTTRYGYQE